MIEAIENGNSLQAEIDTTKKEITTDGYPMSIGELSSLYKDGELDIHPEFQRFFRWSITQKSKLIESILLGIPIPSIFVAQREDGVWDVVDGLQRLSTIFEFMGILREEGGASVPASTLEGTKYLPSLNGKVWESEDQSETFSSAQKLAFKREKIDIKIVRKESHNTFKFELFQRLNTLGSKLSDQEVRNCLLVLVNRGFYNWLRDLSSDANFLESLALTERLIDEQYNMELAVRYLVFTASDPNNVRRTTDLGEYLTEHVSSMAADPQFNYADVEANFKKTFRLLKTALDDNSFNKFNVTRGTFGGAFLISAFELIAIGLGKNIRNYPEEFSRELLEEIVAKVKGIWGNADYTRNSGAGFKASQRVPVIVPLGEQIFRYED